MLMEWPMTMHSQHLIGKKLELRALRRLPLTTGFIPLMPPWLWKLLFLPQPQRPPSRP